MSARDLIRARGGGAVLVVEQLVEGRDALRGLTRSWTPATEERLPCWVQPIGSATAAAYAARRLVVTHKIFVATAPEVKQGWRLRITKDGASKNYAVRGAVDQAGLGQLWRLDVEEVLE